MAFAYILLLFSCLFGVMAFNIDVKNVKIYELDGKDYFGYQVLQYRSEDEKWIIVSAPRGNNGAGKIYKCDHINCTALPLQESNYTIKSIGLSLAAMPEEIMACGAGMAWECDQNTHLNGICYQFSKTLEFRDEITPGYQECTKNQADLVFLLDGSESLKAEDFKMTKEFITGIMANLSNTSFQFAAVQFSDEARTVFSFTDYAKNESNIKLDAESHMRGLGNTYDAIHHVLKNVLTPEAGARQGASQVLLIITDGIPNDNDDYDIIKTTKERKIIRFVILVERKKVTEKDYERIRILASDTENIFYVNSFTQLTSLLEKLQKKIYDVEGTKNARSKKFTKEMSQSGFSSIYLKDSLVLGSVGSDVWRGSLIEMKISGSKYEEIKDSEMEENSYMGYLVAAGKKNNNKVYFTGAPRFRHIGQVVVFYKGSTNWTVKYRETGQQIGSYFGAELCALDIDSDDETDFLLVGAPLFHEPQKEGRMYVYSMSSELKLTLQINVSGTSLGRFAFSISSLKDLNGDKLQDIAVGAPLEDDQRGAVYIYLGDRAKGIQTQFQRITAQKLSSKLQFFGLSIDGKMDQGDDGLTDIVVGSKGNVVLLKSRPVLKVSANVTFSPPKISSDRFVCLTEMESISNIVNLTVCFDVTKSTENAIGGALPWMNVSYELNLDSTRLRSRAFLHHRDKSTRKEQNCMKMELGIQCKTHLVYMPSCVRDTLSPISIKLNFSQSRDEGTAILDPESVTVALLEIPFQSNCQNATCISDLELTFNFTTPKLLVIDQDYFNVTVSLYNRGDDSFNTSLIFRYPPGLSFSKISIIKETRKTLTNCRGVDDMNDKTECSVSRPVYTSKTMAVFQTMFRICNKYNWSDEMEMDITPYSDNGKSSNNTVTKGLQVQYGVDFAVKILDEDSVMYLNFTPDDKEPKVATHVFEVKNLGAIPLPVNITFNFISEARYDFVMEIHPISASQARCGTIEDSNTAQACKGPYKTAQCEISSLVRGLPVRFTVTATVKFSNQEKYQGRLNFNEQRVEVKFVSKAILSYNNQRYIQISSKSRSQDNTIKLHEAEIICQAEMIIPPNKAFIVGVGAGGGFILLIVIVLILYKCGFLKRNKFSFDVTDQTYQNVQAVELKSYSNIVRG
ncbi:integrin alpha-L-like isoform X1 [Brienomyrus brachyistius]|uniref:integrin alpha-L-like isoform X1 n=2 Tax=Brienomyrus brachyistius TaxID=42636 RepID=UPI0020B2DB81|nr:integrin alpha-L-like isoform X1 [Brienomyrus brachyistius]